MMTISRILFPVAFPTDFRAAVQYAAALARHFRSELVLLHVVAPQHSSYGGPDAAAAAVLADSLDESSNFATLLDDELRGLQATRVVLHGDPARKTVEYAHEERCGLILMSTHGHGPIIRFLLGSVTAEVLHDSPVPVWIDPHMGPVPAAGSLHLRHVVCAVDLKPQSQEVVDWTAGVAEEFGSDMAIIHVIPSSIANPDEDFDSDWSVRIAGAARESIIALQERAHAKGDKYIESGDVPGAVCEAAEWLHADLLVIGHSSGPGLAARLGGNAYPILRDSPCAVVST